MTYVAIIGIASRHSRIVIQSFSIVMCCFILVSRDWRKVFTVVSLRKHLEWLLIFLGKMKGIVIYHQNFQRGSGPTYTNSVGDSLGCSTEETLKRLEEVLLGSTETSTHITLHHVQWIGVMPSRFKLKIPPKRTIKPSPLITLTLSNE